MAEQGKRGMVKSQTLLRDRKVVERHDHLGSEVLIYNIFFNAFIIFLDQRSHKTKSLEIVKTHIICGVLKCIRGI